MHNLKKLDLLCDFLCQNLLEKIKVPNFAPLFGLLCPNYALLGVWKGTPLGAQGEGPNMRRNEYLKIIYKSREN